MDGALIGAAFFLLVLAGNSLLRSDERVEVTKNVDGLDRPADLRSQLHPTVHDVVREITAARERADGRCDSCGAANEPLATYCRSCAARLEP